MTDSHESGRGPARSAVGPLAALFLSLRGRLILLVCFATVPALVFIFFVAGRERAAAIERVETEARQLGAFASREHFHQLEGARDLLRRLEEPLSCGRSTDCPDYLGALLDGLPQFANIGVAGTDGSLQCSAVGPTHPFDMRSNPAFVRALESRNAEVGAYVIGPIVGRPVLHVALAIRDGEGRPCRVAFVAVDLRWLDRLSQQTKLPPGYSLLITDRDGHVLAHSGDVPAANDDAPPTLANIDELLQAHGGVAIELGPAAEKRLAVATPMDGVPGIYAVVGLPYDEVQSAASGAFYRTVIGLILLTIFTITVAILAAEVSILRTLRSLSAAARNLGKGDLAVRAPLPRGEGELHDLASSFNSMADALAARHREALATQGRLRALSHRLQVARDTEAGRIARELHDELGQVLTSLTMDLKRLPRMCTSAGENDCAARLGKSVDDLLERIEGSIAFVRGLASELRPTVLDRLGIAAALQWLTSNVESQSGMAVFLDISGLEEPCDNLVSTTLFRVAQEALTNVVRHAKATEVRVDLVQTGDELVLTVHDNGVGIDPGLTEGVQSLGLFGMRERAHLLGGTCSIDGGPGRGTTVIARLPRRPSETMELGVQ